MTSGGPNPDPPSEPTGLHTEIYEKLGVFYLGGSDAEHGTGRTPLLYDSRDLVTHAVCVGMTGSGKTGLCVGLLEEAALDGVPSIVIDPKGDLGNLLLTFPDLAPGDFEPWVSPADARRKGISVEELARAEADKWRAGLHSWGQDAERVRRLRDSADFAIYTPGSNAGLSLSIVKSFSAPPPALREDADLFGERVATAVSSLLGLLGIDADPVQSREHILLSNILATEWATGRDLDLAGIIAAVQDPPFATVGVLDLETFYPKKDRFGLSLAINNLVASPGFAAWMRGEPLDIDRLLFGPEGRPRVSILSIAHLSEQERMFFVALVLNEVLGWVRTQPGSTNLRALVYMDEIYGYIPPVANPPSKRPLLTLLKQARAFGVGLVLATQNPVDLDYKALSNAGTWFIGRLQTSQDKARLVDALDGASANAGEAFDRAQAERIISGLGKRAFLLHNVHEPAPVVFTTRWAMSYLRGPLVRDEIRRLMEPRRAGAQPEPTPTGPTPTERSLPGPTLDGTPTAGRPGSSAAPDTPHEAQSAFVPVSGVAPDTPIRYRPALLARASVTFAHSRSGALVERRITRLLTFDDDGTPAPWDRAIDVSIDPTSLQSTPAPGASFDPLPSLASREGSYRSWRDAFADRLYHAERAHVLHAPTLGVFSRPDEDERRFRIRLAEAARAKKSELVDRVRDKYRARLERVEASLDTAERRLSREQRQARSARAQVGASAGAALLDALFGRTRTAARGAATTMRARDRAKDQAEDVDVAEARIEQLRAERDAIRAELERELAEVAAGADPSLTPLEHVEIPPRRKDVHEPEVRLVWLPLARAEDGATALACKVR